MEPLRDPNGPERGPTVSVDPGDEPTDRKLLRLPDDLARDLERRFSTAQASGKATTYYLDRSTMLEDVGRYVEQLSDAIAQEKDVASTPEETHHLPDEPW